MLERFKGMSPDEQKQFIERIKGRGGDTSAFEKAMAPAAAKSKTGSATQAATTIDALFAPLPTVERPGRAWLYIDKQLKPVNMRTGITDGTNTEVVSGELQPGMEVVTGIVLPNANRNNAAAGAGNPFQQGQGNRGGNFGFPGGGGGRGR
jgi:multidrug efflux pump subunit AcrA (membrane-fusion protein)